MNETGRRIRAERESRGLTRERLAEKANLSVQFLADIENCKKGMTVNTLKKLCTALDVSADYLIFGTGEIVDINRSISALPLGKQRAIAEIVERMVEILV